MQADYTIPGNWESFLRIDDNKTELFAYLAEQLFTLTPSVQTTVVQQREAKLFATHQIRIMATYHRAITAITSGMQKIIIRTVDTDVVVIAVSAVHKLELEKTSGTSLFIILLYL